MLEVAKDNQFKGMVGGVELSEKGKECVFEVAW